MYKQKAKPKAAIPKINFEFFLKAAIRIIMYPVKPIKGVGIPKVLATGPEITASQFIVALILHGLKAGLNICCQRR